MVHTNPLRLLIPDSLYLPIQTATFQQPHSTNILQKANCAFYATFIRKVQSLCFSCNHRCICFHPHQRPSTATQICKITIKCGNICYSRSGIMSGHRNHRNCPQSCYLLHFFSQCSYLLTLGRQNDRNSLLSVRLLSATPVPDVAYVHSLIGQWKQWYIQLPSSRSAYSSTHPA